jgi:hypothetical protein
MKLCVAVILFLLTSIAIAQPPRIDSMSIDEWKGLLSVYGEFGSTQGKVWCDSVGLAVRSWNDTLIVSDIANSGKGSFGAVTVEVNATKSNTQFLTEWIWSFERDAERYSRNSYESETIVLQTSVRLDIQSVITNHSYPSNIRFISLKSIENKLSGVDTVYKSDSLQCNGVFSLSKNFIYFDGGLSQISLPNDSLQFTAILDSNLHIIDSNFTNGYYAGAGMTHAMYMTSGNVYFLPPNSVLALLSSPSLIFPGNFSTNVSSDSEFSWGSLPGFNLFRLQVFSDSLATIVLDTLVDRLQFRYTLLSGHKYYWRVCAVNESGEGKWSNVWSFTTGGLSAITNNSKGSRFFAVFPNPAKDILHISTSAGHYNFAIYNLQGIILKLFEPGITAIDVSAFPSGNYILGTIAGSQSSSTIVSIIR